MNKGSIRYECLSCGKFTMFKRHTHSLSRARACAGCGSNALMISDSGGEKVVEGETARQEQSERRKSQTAGE